MAKTKPKKIYADCDKFEWAGGIIANLIQDTKKQIAAGKQTKKFYKTVLEALQKRTPTKPPEDKSTDCTARVYLCPSCGKLLFKGHKAVEYCNVCGQALDWREDT